MNTLVFYFCLSSQSPDTALSHWSEIFPKYQKILIVNRHFPQKPRDLQNSFAACADYL